MVEITSEEQNQVKRMKRTEDMRIVSKTSGAISIAPTFQLWGPRRRREKERV